MNRRTSTRALLAALALILAVPSIASAQDAMGGPPQVSPQVKRQRMKLLFDIIKREPSIADVQRNAVEHYELETDRINSMSTRARTKALIPEIEASFDNMVGNNFNNTKDGLFPILPSPAANPNPNNYKERQAGSNDQKTWHVRAVWSLDRLIFNAESLDAKSLTALQENLVREVTTLYFARRRVLAGLIVSPPEDEQEYFYELQRLEEMTATLDALTGHRYAKKTWQWDDPKWLQKTPLRKKAERRIPTMPGLARLGR